LSYEIYQFKIMTEGKHLDIKKRCQPGKSSTPFFYTILHVIKWKMLLRVIIWKLVKKQKFTLNYQLSKYF
jgi:hypothetical protein